MFSRYSGSLPLEATSIDDIPLEEQAAYFASRGWDYGEDLAPDYYIPEERDDEMYAAWATVQVEEYGLSTEAA